MNQEFKDWIVADLRKQPMSARAAVLRSVKFFPEEALQAIHCCLEDWAIQYASKAGNSNVFVINYQNDPEELLEAFKQNFVTELSEIAE
jgi:hypothetical protein